MGAHIEPLINELRTILRNPPPHLQALRSAATKAQWALRQSVGVPPSSTGRPWMVVYEWNGWGVRQTACARNRLGEYRRSAQTLFWRGCLRKEGGNGNR